MTRGGQSGISVDAPHWHASDAGSCDERPHGADVVHGDLGITLLVIAVDVMRSVVVANHTSVTWAGSCALGISWLHGVSSRLRLSCGTATAL